MGPRTYRADGELGQLTLRNLKLKKGALDKFQLPVDVLEGKYFSNSLMSINNLTSQVRSSRQIYPLSALDELGQSTR